MTDTTENLILEHLNRFQSGQDRIERKLDELTRRVSNLEIGQASIIQHIGHLAAADAQ
jgi:outer membrane translocation and assembly module TamA